MVEYFVGPDEEADRYRLIEPHAGGGESEVWRGEVTVGDVGLAVAVKVLRPDLGDAERWRQRWRDQVELLRSLGRPGIVAVREGFEGARLHTAGDASTVDQRALYLVMEWVEGPSLHEWVTVREPGRDRTQGLKMVWQVAAAVDYLHSGQMTSGRAVLHRDIKPSNVIVTDRGAVLVDFGLVKVWDHGPGSLVGTPGFRAPEVAVDGVHTPASDRYAVGALAFFVITGQPPTTDLDAARQRLTASLSDADVERGLVGHVLAMLDPDPSRRPESVSSWAQFLAQSTLSEPVEVTVPLVAATPLAPAPGSSPTAVLPANRRSKRRRWPWVALAAALLVLAGVVVATTVLDADGEGDGDLVAVASDSDAATSTTSAQNIEVEQNTTTKESTSVMPDLVGERWLSASRELDAAGVDVEKVEELNGDERDGTVIAQSTRSGATLPDTVELVVARRPIASHLADLEPVEHSYLYNSDIIVGPAELSGSQYRQSVTVQQNSCADTADVGYADYLASRDFDRFMATGGLADYAPAAAILRMEIFGDGSLLDSKTVRVGDEFEIDVDATDILRMRLQTTIENWNEIGAGCGDKRLHSIWGDARFVTAPPPLS